MMIIIEILAPWLILLISIKIFNIFLKKFSLLYKVIFLTYIATLAIMFYDVKTKMIICDEITLFKFLMIGPTLFIFLTIMSFISDYKVKRKILCVSLEYGLLYFFMVLSLKLFIFLISNGDYSAIDLFVTGLPYKGVLYVIVVVIYIRYFRDKIKNLLKKSVRVIHTKKLLKK